MLMHFTLLILFAGVPYFLLLEKSEKVRPDKVFLFSVLLLIIGLCLASSFPIESSTPFVTVAFVSALLAFLRATKTTNFYKLSYYLIFMNAPMLIVFDVAQSALYSISLVLTLFGLYFMGKHYEKHYGSANYHSVSGVTLMTPYAGLFLTLYLITLALYPPFPNALIFLHTIMDAPIDMLWYGTVLLIFFGNFILAMRVMAMTVFGKANPNIHYVELSTKEKFLHLSIIIGLCLLSLWGLKEVLV
jgi:hypothetical protein